MSDDLVRRLRCYADIDDAVYNPWVYGEAADRIEKLEAVLQNIAEGDVPRIVKIPFRDDGQSSKHDRCKHGQWFYEDCGGCIEDYARKALEGKDER